METVLTFWPNLSFKAHFVSFLPPSHFVWTCCDHQKCHRQEDPICRRFSDPHPIIAAHSGLFCFFTVCVCVCADRGCTLSFLATGPLLYRFPLFCSIRKDLSKKWKSSEGCTKVRGKLGYSRQKENMFHYFHMHKFTFPRRQSVCHYYIKALLFTFPSFFKKITY